MASILAGGCLAVKTEHEVKPIHITMDVNLKVDRELDKALDGETRQPPPHAAEIKALMDAGKVGLDNRGYRVARAELTPEEDDMLQDANAARRAKMAEIAQRTGASRADVETRHAEKARDRIPAGKGIWYQDHSGAWHQK